MYVDSTYYTNTYKGSIIPTAELDSFLSKASDVIDELSYQRIVGKGGLDKLTAFQKEQVKKAVCEQADFMYNSSDMPEWVNSYSVGSVSVSKEKGSTNYSKRSLMYLKSTGLMYRRLG